MAATDSVSTQPRPRGSWALAGVEADAFANTPQVRAQLRLWRHGCLRVGMWLILLVCDRRVNEDATALCLFAPLTFRKQVRALARLGALGLVVTAGAVAIALVWPPLVWLLALGFLLLVTPCARSGWANRRAKAALESFGPDGPAIYVHSVARVPGPEEKGAGARVMQALTAEAEEKGWRLVLDAGDRKLVDYYRRFGFEPAGEPVSLTWGTAVRMVREPSAREPKVDHG